MFKIKSIINEKSKKENLGRNVKTLEIFTRNQIIVKHKIQIKSHAYHKQ